MHIDWLLNRAQLTPNKTALVDTLHDNRAITYSEWNRSANRAANFLRERLGVSKGDRVAVLAMNCVEYLDVWFACQKIGAILQNLNWRLNPLELIGVINDAAPRVLIYGGDFLTQVEAIRADVAVTHFVAFDQPLNDDLPFAGRDGCADSLTQTVDLTFDDVWVICYTGGTTGLPKGAMLTHGNITFNSVNTVMSWGLTPDDVTILNSPLFHTGGLNVFTAPLVHIGGTSIVCKTFEVDQVYNLLNDSGVTLWFGVPTMFTMMQQHPRWNGAGFSKLKLLISGGAPCPLPIFEKFWAKGVDFKTGYGLTEAGPNTFWLPPEDVRRKPGSVGFPLFHVEVKIIKEDRECGADEVGELLIRGSHVCKGYWHNPDETAKAIRDGWLYTGDLARRDSEGYYYIVGRSKDMIISGGENIYPAEVESAIAAHESVAEVALIGIPDEKWGEVGRAVVVIANGESITQDELIKFCGERLAKYKVPKSIVFVDSIPKTGANKVDKLELVRTYGKA